MVSENTNTFDYVYCLYLNNIIAAGENLSNECDFESYLNDHFNINNDCYEFTLNRKLSFNKKSKDFSSDRKGLKTNIVTPFQRGDLFFIYEKSKEDEKIIDVWKLIYEKKCENNEYVYEFKKYCKFDNEPIDYYCFLNSKYWILDIGTLWFSVNLYKNIDFKCDLIKFEIVTELKTEFREKIESFGTKLFNQSMRAFIKLDSESLVKKDSDDIQFYKNDDHYDFYLSGRFCAQDLSRSGLYNLIGYNKKTTSKLSYLPLKNFIQSGSSNKITSSNKCPVTAIWNIYFCDAQNFYGKRENGSTEEDKEFIEYLVKAKRLSESYAKLFANTFRNRILKTTVWNDFFNKKKSASENKNDFRYEEKRRAEFFKEAKEKCKGGAQPGLTVENMLKAYFEFLDWTISGKSLPSGYEYKEQGEGFNLIVFGCPGSGKSTFVTKYCEEHQIEITRTTFYEDYSNSDFVGQIIPVVDEKSEKNQISYEFHPGPFTEVLFKAYSEPYNNFALVIEEINRGNAPAIFGDIFQLLDRTDHLSTFDIVNYNIQKYLENKFSKETDENCFFDSIKLPRNLYIFGTMNSGDQNVFTLDTAFKRRWKFKKLKNVFLSEKDKFFIPGSKSVTWRKFAETINSFILEYSDGIVSAEDKQLGSWFVEPELLVDKMEDSCINDDVKGKIEDFSYKIFEYLWDDVAKFNRQQWFCNKIRTLEDIIGVYIKNCEEGTLDDNWNMLFSEEVCQKLNEISNVE